MTLGEPGVAGNDENHFNAPAGVVTAPNGDIFIADGHGPNNRIVKFSKDGKFIKAWGKTGYAPGEFRVAALHLHGQARPAVRVRSLERPHPDLRPGWEVSWRGGTSSGCRAGSPSRSTTKT